MMENARNAGKKYHLSQKRLKLNLQTKLAEDAEKVIPASFSKYTIFLIEKIKCFN